MLGKSVFVGASLLTTSLASNYKLVDDYSGSNFFNKMTFFTGADPTSGFVEYVNRTTAYATGMVSSTNGAVIMGVDHTNIAAVTGRRSVRVTSTKQYTHMLVTADFSNMPGGTCGTWPAFWAYGPNWPNGGEIDIIEGVNSQTTNIMTLHTNSGCSVSNQGVGLLKPYSGDCNSADNGNEGCSFHETNPLSYGTAAKHNGGAQYAMEWTSLGVKIWWWNRKNPAPADFSSANPNPANWGRPSANWAGSGCNWDGHFSSQQLVFDTTFCGSWASAVWATDPVCSKLASTCTDYVTNNPGAFATDYWAIRSLKVYQNNGMNNDKRDAASDGSTLDARESLPEPVAEPVLLSPYVENEKRAFANQIAPSIVPLPSQTVDAVKASQSAIAHPGSAGSSHPKDRDISEMNMNRIRHARYAPKI